MRAARNSCDGFEPAARQPAYAGTVNKEFQHEPENRRYAMYLDDDLVAVVDYAKNTRAVSITRVYTKPSQRGQGRAAEIMEFAVNDIETTTTLDIVPMCSYAGDWFEKNPGRAGLLTR
jgi:predicted GNAT family acetyltransferase